MESLGIMLSIVVAAEMPAHLILARKDLGASITFDRDLLDAIHHSRELPARWSRRDICQAIVRGVRVGRSVVELGTCNGSGMRTSPISGPRSSNVGGGLRIIVLSERVGSGGGVVLGIVLLKRGILVVAIMVLLLLRLIECVVLVNMVMMLLVKILVVVALSMNMISILLRVLLERHLLILLALIVLVLMILELHVLIRHLLSLHVDHLLPILLVSLVVVSLPLLVLLKEHRGIAKVGEGCRDRAQVRVRVVEAILEQVADLAGVTWLHVHSNSSNIVDVIGRRIDEVRMRGVDCGSNVRLAERVSGWLKGVHGVHGVVSELGVDRRVELGLGGVVLALLSGRSNESVLGLLGRHDILVQGLDIERILVGALSSLVVVVVKTGILDLVVVRQSFGRVRFLGPMFLASEEDILRESRDELTGRTGKHQPFCLFRPSSTAGACAPLSYIVSIISCAS